MCSAGNRLCGWVEAHFEEFRPTLRPSLTSVEQAKKFGELSLVLWALTAPRHRAGKGTYAAWAQDVARLLWPDLEAIGAQLPWDRLPGHPLGELLVLFPVLEGVTGRRSRFHDQVAGALRGCPEPAPGDLKLAFARDMAGITDCRPPAVRELTTRLSAWQRDHAVATSSWLYTVTHTIFYATRLGTRRFSLPATLDVRWGRILGSYATERLAARHYDIAAELLAAISWTGHRSRPAFLEGAADLAVAVQDEGSVPTRLPLTGNAEFENRYHATIITLTVLAEAEL